MTAEAGYAEGFEASLNTGNPKSTITHAEVLTEQLREIGIDLKIDAGENATYQVKRGKGPIP